MSLNWKSARYFILTYSMLAIGAIIGAFSVQFFLAPFDIAPSGVAGLSVILNHLIGTPVGVMTFLFNIPIQYFAYRSLPGGWRSIFRTIFVVIVYTTTLDLLANMNLQPPLDLQSEVLLSDIFGGVVGGIGSGIVIRAGGSFGGTSTLAIIIQRRTGMPLNSIYLYTDSIVILIAVLIFGWKAGLLALLAIFLDGLASGYILEGPSVIRTVVIITNKADEVSQAIFEGLGRGVTAWEAKGMYTGEMRTVLYVSIGRSQVQDLRRLMLEADPEAFMVVGQGHAAYGHGFKRIAPRLDLNEPI
jgi:uncharacterized membrane-anchored protein YitT (DUF2179 family)